MPQALFDIVLARVMYVTYNMKYKFFVVYINIYANKLLRGRINILQVEIQSRATI